MSGSLLADVFNNDIFSYVSMTASINKLPMQPSKLGDLKLFKQDSTMLTVAVIEEEQGKLSLVQTAQRGTRTKEQAHAKRKSRAFEIPHLPQYDIVKADEILGIRDLQTEGANSVAGLKTVAGTVNKRLEAMKMNIDVTKEWHRAGAIQGLVKDADGSTLLDLFTVFGIIEEEFEFDFAADATEDVKVTAQKVWRAMIFSLGNTPFTGIQAICGDDFWDAFISAKSVKDAYQYYASNTMLQQQQRNGFMFADIHWMNYTARVGSTDLIPATICRFVPIGGGDILLEINAPADFMEAVGTLGQPYYAKQERMPFDKGIDLHAQANPLIMCTRPACLKKGTIAP